MKCIVSAILGVVGIAASAHAEVSWTTNIQFLVTGPAGSGYSNAVIASGGTGPNNPIAGVYTVTLQVGIFNLSGQPIGQSNQGLFNWAGRVSTSGLQSGETLDVTNATSRISPFNFGPSTAFGGAVVNGGTGLDGNSVTPGSLIQASRDVAAGASSVWPGRRTPAHGSCTWRPWCRRLYKRFSFSHQSRAARSRRRDNHGHRFGWSRPRLDAIQCDAA